jgi:hypothetical protein|tara:strand:+ start:330 stop:704 length:375 start_codon:yes stop_codon:yes gene_type:complete
MSWLKKKIKETRMQVKLSSIRRKRERKEIKAVAREADFKARKAQAVRRATAKYAPKTGKSVKGSMTMPSAYVKRTSKKGRRKPIRRTQKPKKPTRRTQKPKARKVRSYYGSDAPPSYHRYGGKY